HHRMLAEQMKKAAEAQLAAGRGSTQDALAAEVQIGMLAQDRLGLETDREATIAQLDGLLHMAPDAPLPPPLVETATTTEPPALEVLLRMAAERPDAHAANERIAGDTARVDAADRTFYPDFELMASYDSMWDMPEHRWMVGVAIEVPLQRSKREAAADGARARVAQVSAELDRLRDDIRVAVFRARREVVESNAMVTSYDERLLPASRAQIDAALQGFVIGRNDFSTVLAAEHGARDVEIGAARARAQLSKRRTALDKATGRLPGGGVP
ncbi:MAG TPA: TolC family protein, partial [Kofleriaceae bacterium]|nr:TolC family protein [Kofleriaceae bacterium]